MFFEVILIIAVLAIGIVWWRSRRAAPMRSLADEDDPSTPHDHARSHERAQAQADLQRWSGPQ